MSKNNSTISVPNPKLCVICPISVIIASKDLDLERVSSAWLGSAEQGTNDKEWVMEPARKMCRTKNDNENLTLKHISFTFCSLFRVEIIKTSNKLTVFDIQWLHFVGRGAFPNARPRRLSADVCVLELEDNNPKYPWKENKTFAVFPFFASQKPPPWLFFFAAAFFWFLPKGRGLKGRKFPAWPPGWSPLLLLRFWLHRLLGFYLDGGSPLEAPHPEVHRSLTSVGGGGRVDVG